MYTLSLLNHHPDLLFFMKYKVFKIIFIICLSPVLILNGQIRIWNIDNLENAKSLTSEAAKLIIRDANKDLAKTLVTVMDKPMTPPSADKHDYMSMGRYWWPDPSKADGLPYIRKDGVVNHEIDKLDRGPLGAFARSIKNLSIAYFLTSDDKYALKAVENLQIWFINKDTKMNPNMNYGQTIPGRRDGEGRGEGVLDSYSFVEMLDGVELLRSSKLFTQADQLTIKVWFTSYLDWMLTSEIGNEERTAKNNHGTAFDVQATRYALFTGKKDVATKIITEFPANRLFKQIQPDGSQPLELARTTALGYSTFNLTHLLDMCSIAKSINIDLFNSTSGDGRSISKAVEFLVPFIGTRVEEFKYKQIKDWDAVQLKLCWQIYRADQFRPRPIYKNIYSHYLNSDEKEINTLLY